MKSLNQFIIESITKNKSPKNKKELISNIKELIGKGVTDLNCIDTSKITDMSYLFDRELSKIKNINISNWDVSNVENMHSMFIYCENFEGKGLENWDVSNVTDMYRMFFNCKNFNCNLSKWNVSNVENMLYLFDNCTSLKNTPRWYKE